MNNIFLTKEQKDKKAEIAAEQIEIGRRAQMLAKNDDFRYLFGELRNKVFLRHSMRMLNEAILDENDARIKEASQDIRKLKSIDWYIKTLLDYYKIGQNEMREVEAAVELEEEDFNYAEESL